MVDQPSIQAKPHGYCKDQALTAEVLMKAAIGEFQDQLYATRTKAEK